MYILLVLFAILSPIEKHKIILCCGEAYEVQQQKMME